MEEETEETYTCSDCGERIEDSCDVAPFDHTDEVLCVWCYRERIND